MSRRLWSVLVLCLVAYGVMVGLSSDAYLATRDRAGIAPTLPLKFAHVAHAEQQCVECRHNYEDDTGQGLCIDCHYRDPELAALMHDQFHDLCRGCHLEKALSQEDHGPLRHCEDCHQEDLLP